MLTVSGLLLAGSFQMLALTLASRLRPAYTHVIGTKGMLVSRNQCQ